MSTYPFDAMGAVVKEHTTKMVRDLVEAVKIIAQDGLSSIVDNTPVDTTRAVSNWQVSTLAAATDIREPVVPGSVKGSGAGTARTSVKEEGIGNMGSFQADGVIYIANNVPYIKVLEYGGPKNAPSGMVAKGLQAMSIRAKTLKIWNS